MELKFLIIGNNDTDFDRLKVEIEEQADNLIIANQFTNNIEYKDTENQSCIYYLDNKVIQNALKNNAVFYIKNNVFVEGVTYDEFYNSNIFTLSIKDFNTISTNVLDKYSEDILVVWLDYSKHKYKDELNNDIKEISYLMDKLEKLNYIYFLDEEYSTIAKTIIEYYYGDADKRTVILEENS